ncbi:MAG: CHASE2 domain-containing protein [Synechococcales bacterium]|nr:CHASE2 domain-containing protein [Synechococcales bacterium]
MLFSLKKIFPSQLSPKQIFMRSHPVFVIVPTVAIAAIAGNVLGAFNLLEWGVRDEFFRLRPREAIEDKIVVVTIDEADIQSVKSWPIPDQSLAELVEKIRSQQPRVIGMDLYRDLPEEPGHKKLVEVFKSTPQLIGVEKVTGDRVDPAPALKEKGQVGMADLVLDPDQKVRRGLLTAQDDKDGNAIKAGLATQVALKYLEAEKITLEAVNANQQIYRLGKATYQPLTQSEGGYPNGDLGGYQILLNWRGPTSMFPTVTMRDVLSGKVPADQFRDRIVFIGSVAISTNDFFKTPYSSSWFYAEKPTPGVIIHANLASQLVRSAIEGRSGLRGFTHWQQTSWIFLWTLCGTVGSWSLARYSEGKRNIIGGRIFWASLGMGTFFMVGSYGLFVQGVLIPVVAPLTALITAVIATTNAYKHQRLVEANGQLLDYSKTLEIKVEERTKELATAKIAADAANQAKSEFLANMSHELRTPLNGILGYAQVLERSSTLDHKQREGISIIHQCGSHLLTLINDILDLSKIEARKLELYPNDLNLPSFLHGVAEICRIRAEQKGISFYTDFDPNLPQGIQADEKRLRQVLINLLGNAIKFTDQGSVTFKVKLSPHTEHTTDTDSNALLPLRFQVEDTGVGMTPAQLQKIFLPFEQVGESNRKADGTGLGLAISQRITNLMGSELQVQSQQGEGSIFWLDVILPIAQDWRIRDRFSSQKVIGLKSDAPKLLIVDSVDESQAMLTDLLQPLGFQIISAKDGQQGLEMAQQRQPDWILTDLEMPALHGHELIQTLRQDPLFQQTPIVVSSASVFEADQSRSLEAGATAFLPKPIQVNDLLQILQEHLQLEWNYADAQEVVSSLQTPIVAQSVKEIIPPNPEILEKLQHLAMMGDLASIEGTIEELDVPDTLCAGFFAELRKLTGSYQTKKIREFLKSFTPAVP